MNIALEVLAGTPELPKNDIKDDVDEECGNGDLLSILELLNEPGAIV